MRTCAPSTSHSCSCRPSPIRCRSTSPSVGQVAVRVVGGVRAGRRRSRPRAGSRAPSGSGEHADPDAVVLVLAAGSASARRARRSPTSASGRSARTVTPPSCGCAPSTACGSWWRAADDAGRGRLGRRRVDRGAVDSGSRGVVAAVRARGPRAGASRRDRAERDRQPGRPVAGLVDHLVDRLVGLEARAAAAPSSRGSPSPPRRWRSRRRRRPVALGPLGGAVRDLPVAPRRPVVGDDQVARRSRRTAACRRRRATGESGRRPLGRAACAGSPSKSRIFQPLHGAQDLAEVEVAVDPLDGRRLAGSAATTSSKAARSPSAYGSQLGTTSQRGVEPGLHALGAGGRARSAVQRLGGERVGERRRAPRRSPRPSRWPRRRSRRRPRRRAGRPRRTGRARWPARAPSRRSRCAGTAGASPAARGSSASRSRRAPASRRARRCASLPGSVSAAWISMSGLHARGRPGGRPSAGCRRRRPARCCSARRQNSEECASRSSSWPGSRWKVSVADRRRSAARRTPAATARVGLAVVQRRRRRPTSPSSASSRRR